MQLLRKLDDKIITHNNINMAIKYIPASKHEIQLFRRNRAIKERNRKEITDNTLIALRRVHLFQQKNTANFENSAEKLNSFIKLQKNQRVLEVINYFIADI